MVMINGNQVALMEAPAEDDAVIHTPPKLLGISISEYVACD